MKQTLHFDVSSIVHAPVDAVWTVLGDFGTEHRWTRSLTHCCRDTADVRVGTVRSCRLPKPLMGRSDVREALTEFEPGQTLAYSLAGSAGPFASAASRWSTRPAANQKTMITVEGWFQPKNMVIALVLWPFIKPMLRRFTKGVVRELDAFIAANAEPVQH